MKITITEEYTNFENGTVKDFCAGICAACGSMIKFAKSNDYPVEVIKVMLMTGMLKAFELEESEESKESVTIDGNLINLLKKFKEEEDC